MRVLLITDLYEPAERWQQLIDVLQKFDLPAEVFTYNPPRTDDLSDIVAEASQHLIDETYIVGFGIGGRVAIQLASQNPHHLAGTLLISTPAMPAPGFRHFLYRVWRFFSAPIRILVPFYLRKKAMAAIKKARPGNPKKVLYREISATPMDTFFGKITDPVLLLWGSKDTKTNPRVAEIMSDLMSELDVQHDLQFVNQAGADLHVTHPTVVASAVISATTH